MNVPPSIPELVMQWQEVRSRTILARHRIEGNEHPDDYWTELRLGAEIAREVMAGRWVVVSALLRLGAVESWAAVGEALGVNATAARDGFRGWISGQRDLYRRTGSGGLTEAEAEDMHALAERVTF